MKRAILKTHLADHPVRRHQYDHYTCVICGHEQSLEPGNEDHMEHWVYNADEWSSDLFRCTQTISHESC